MALPRLGGTMTIRRLLLLCACAVVAAVPACSGDDDDDDGNTGNGELASGPYEGANTVVVADECAVLDAGLDGVVLDVVVTGDQITIDDDATGAYDAGVFTAELVNPLDFNQDPFGLGAEDCVVDVVVTFDGFTTAENEADVHYSLVVENLVGSDCDAAAAQISIEFPCESEADFHISTYVPPPPLSGTLSLLATGGQLTLVGDEAQDSGFALSGTIDGEGPFTEASATWICYAPDLPSFPNYDLIIGGLDYGVFLSVTTGNWAVGSVPLASLASASFSSPDSDAEFTSGNLDILAAPMVVDSAYRCAVQITDAPFLEAAAFASGNPKRLDPLRSWRPAPQRRR